MIEDIELKEMKEMEIHYERACKLHDQFTTQVINRRLKFQENCPHYETKVSDYTDIVSGRNYYVYHCVRCNKLIKKEERNEQDLVYK